MRASLDLAAQLHGAVLEVDPNVLAGFRSIGDKPGAWKVTRLSQYS